jgi:hypothetical protein
LCFPIKVPDHDIFLNAPWQTKSCQDNEAENYILYGLCVESNPATSINIGRQGQVTHGISRQFIDQDLLLRTVASADYPDARVPGDDARAADTVDFDLKNFR